MEDSRYKRLLACLDDIACSALEAETDEVRKLADELPASDPQVFLLKLTARALDETHRYVGELQAKLHEAGA